MQLHSMIKATCHLVPSFQYKYLCCKNIFPLICCFYNCSCQQMRSLLERETLKERKTSYSAFNKALK